MRLAEKIIFFVCLIPATLYAGSFDEIPLNRAIAHRNHVAVLQLLLHGTDPFINGKDGRSAIDLALGTDPAIKNDVINSRNYLRGGETPLMRTAFDGNARLAQQLMLNGADLFLEKVDGATAFDFAIWSPDEEIKKVVLFPLEFGNKISIKDDQIDESSQERRRFFRIRDSQWSFNVLRQKQDDDYGVTQNNLLLEFKFADVQVVSLNLRSGYLRLRPAESSSWGTSIELFPAMWIDHDRINSSRAQLDIDKHITDEKQKSSLLDPHYGLIIDSNSDNSLIFQFRIPKFWGLDLYCTVKISAPDLSDKIVAHVLMTINNDKGPTLSERKYEMFMFGILSSMHIDENRFDAHSARISKNGNNIQFSQGESFGEQEHARFIQLVGGNSYYDSGLLGRISKNNPSVSIENVDAKDAKGAKMPIHSKGNVSITACQDDDNIAFWFSTSAIPTFFRYSIVAEKP